ncbi:MAG: hypothetical protein PVF73_06645 [Bacteroidales bacterium]
MRDKLKNLSQFLLLRIDKISEDINNCKAAQYFFTDVKLRINKSVIKTGNSSITQQNLKKNSTHHIFLLFWKNEGVPLPETSNRIFQQPEQSEF